MEARPSGYSRWAQPSRYFLICIAFKRNLWRIFSILRLFISLPFYCVFQIHASVNICEFLKALPPHSQTLVTGSDTCNYPQVYTSLSVSESKLQVQNWRRKNLLNPGTHLKQSKQADTRHYQGIRGKDKGPKAVNPDHPSRPPYWT